MNEVNYPWNVSLSERIEHWHYFFCLFFTAGKRVTRKEEIEAIHWKSWTSVLGAEVNGIWEKYTDTTDVNAADTNFQHGTIVTGDDFGLVKLFRFPCIKKGKV